jgi:tetratricopeptide (TPR) repeat protein
MHGHADVACAATGSRDPGRTGPSLTRVSLGGVTVRASLVLALLFALAAPARAQDDAQSRARGHYEIGLGHYRLGDYRAALKEFAAGYQLAHKPGFLLNLAQSYRKLGDLERARAHYRQFLAEAPADDRNRAQTEQIVAEIDAQLREHPQAPVPDAALDGGAVPVSETNGGGVTSAPGVAPQLSRPAVRRPDHHALRLASYTLGGVGVAALGCGVAFALIADKTARDINQVDATGGVFDAGKDSAYHTYRTVEAVTFGVGGALVATGVVLYIVGRR